MANGNWLVWLWFGLCLVACQSVPPPTIPTQVAVAPTVFVVDGQGEAIPLPATWTPAATSELAPAGITPHATFTPRPTHTPIIFPSATPIRTPTSLPTIALTVPAGPTLPPIASPTPSPAPAGGPNLLPNPSFEGGWYHIDNIPELQVADSWFLDWDEGPNSLDPDPWNRWVRPEMRVLPKEFLPAAERPIFIWDGDQTVKIFKGTGAVSFQLFTEVYLEAGNYNFTVNVFPDLVVGYRPDGTKIWAPDPLSGEVRFILGDIPTGWVLPSFGRKNTFSRTFTLSEGQTIRLGLAIRGRWAIQNNGWFMDDWSLYRLND